MDAAWLQGLVTTLNPQNQPGRLTLIHRFGAKDVAAALPQAIEAVRQTGQSVLWVCDPMHGNTETTHRRTQDAALREHSQGARSGVPHPRRAWARTSAACTSSSPARTSPSAPAARAGSPTRTCSAPTARSVDPRLNHEQALELAMLIAERSQTRRADKRPGAAAPWNPPCSISTSPFLPRGSGSGSMPMARWTCPTSRSFPSSRAMASAST